MATVWPGGLAVLQETSRDFALGWIALQHHKAGQNGLGLDGLPVALAERGGRGIHPVTEWLLGFGCTSFRKQPERHFDVAWKQFGEAGGTAGALVWHRRSPAAI